MTSASLDGRGTVIARVRCAGVHISFGAFSLRHTAIPGSQDRVKPN